MSDTLRVLGVDTGGTFTDFVYYCEGQLTIHKVLSTPEAPEKAILQGIDELGLNQALDGLSIVHGSTVATNAALEGKGVRTVYITNRGLADVLTLGRQARRDLYDLQPKPPLVPVPPADCFEVDARVDAKGDILQRLDSDALAQVRQFVASQKPEAVAINLLFSFLNDDDEKQLEQSLSGLKAASGDALFVSRSSQVLPEYKEYERGIATWLNAWVGPLVQGYLKRLALGISPARLAVMQSSAGTIAADQAAQQAVRMLLSGPAGGLAGAQFVASLAGHDRLLTFDMGGTSTDVALIEGEVRLTSESSIGDFPVAVPMVDMHTIGAGGGSLAYLDEGGLLQVGPESAGASPGPACYGKGGTRPAVTDANLVLGRLSESAFLGGSMRLDREASCQALQPIAEALHCSIEEAALGVIEVANEHMVRALRVMSVQRGVDPSELTLVPFGGAGALHVCALAEALNMQKALVPVQAGVLSALGMLVAPHTRELSRSQVVPVACAQTAGVAHQFDEMLSQGSSELKADGVDPESIIAQASVDLRYRGQSYYLNLPVGYPLAADWQSEVTHAFHQRHEQRYGHQLSQPVELVNLRLQVKSPGLSIEMPQRTSRPANEALKPYAERQLFGVEKPVPVFARDELQAEDRFSGPALITERVSTTFVQEGWQCRVDALGNLHLSAGALA